LPCHSCSDLTIDAWPVSEIAIARRVFPHRWLVHAPPAQGWTLGEMEDQIDLAKNHAQCLREVVAAQDHDTGLATELKPGCEMALRRVTAVISFLPRSQLAPAVQELLTARALEACDNLNEVLSLTDSRSAPPVVQPPGRSTSSVSDLAPSPGSVGTIRELEKTAETLWRRGVERGAVLLWVEAAEAYKGQGDTLSALVRLQETLDRALPCDGVPDAVVQDCLSRFYRFGAQTGANGRGQCLEWTGVRLRGASSSRLGRCLESVVATTDDAEMHTALTQLIQPSRP